jgi:hypothetical protein
MADKLITQQDPSVPSPAQVPVPPPVRTWKQSKWMAVAEFILIALIFFADHKHLVPVSKTPFLLVLGWISLRLRGLRWRSVGLTRKRSWPLTIALGVAAGLAMEVIELFVTQPLLIHFSGRQTSPRSAPFRAT